MTTTDATTSHAGGEITKVSVNMIRRSMTALDVAADLTGLSRTDCLNRAIQIYAYIEKIQHDGGRLLVQQPDGRIETFDIL